jgi:hypothetical protein
VSALGRIARAAALAVALGALPGGQAAAQERTHTGYWIDAGLGYGRLRLKCATCSGVGTSYGGLATLTLGHTMSERVVLGLEGQLWSHWGNGADEQVRSLTVVAQWYPWIRTHFFMRGGTGIVQGPVSPSFSGTPRETVQGTGVGLMLAVGYDVPIDRRVALAVQVSSHVAALGDLRLQGVTLQDTIGYVTGIAVTVAYR